MGMGAPTPSAPRGDSVSVGPLRASWSLPVGMGSQFLLGRVRDTGGDHAVVEEDRAGPRERDLSRSLPLDRRRRRDALDARPGCRAGAVPPEGEAWSRRGREGNPLMRGLALGAMLATAITLSSSAACARMAPPLLLVQGR